MPPSPILDTMQIDLSHVVADVEQIRRFNPHRGHMEQLSAVVLIDQSQHLIAGYKDVGHDEFWVEGHMPGYPILPGVIMCEAAAQLVNYYAMYHGILRDSLLGLGGIEDARFRAPVCPGDRLLLVGQGKRVDRRQTVFDVQGFVGPAMVFHCRVIGVPLPRGNRKATNGVAHEIAPGG
jgi:3-hydroxyacyl-[acyl-carrier-protein] dehydratase